MRQTPHRFDRRTEREISSGPQRDSSVARKLRRKFNGRGQMSVPVQFHFKLAGARNTFVSQINIGGYRPKIEFAPPYRKAGI
jgi:hypothetical protein